MPGILKPIFLQASLTAILAVMLCVSLGCSNDESGTAITVFAAASLTDAFTDIARDFESRNPGVAVRLNFAGSQRLRLQLERGAKADVFASADEIQMTLARDAGLIEGESITLATADMAVIVTERSGIRVLAELANPGVKLVLAHESVPAGQYSRQLLAVLSAPDSELGRDFADRALANVVSEETGVKSVEQKVVLGQADAGIVYRPGALSALSAAQVLELPLPPSVREVKALYPIAVLKESGNQELSGMFIRYVLSDSAQETLAAYGFGPP